ncbi:MAG TPA: rhomboid family intramembrane serine protease [Gaiellaceae bacterium]|nr:rhomboid family intramembrane serine protease [Gaiellaceae bacterium]
MDEPRYCYRHPDRETGLSCSECGRSICYECMTPAPVGLRCPEHSGKPQGVRKLTAPAQRAVTGVGARRVNAVTLALIAINIGVYVAELAAGGTVDGVNNWIYNHGALFASGAYTQGTVGTLPAHAFAPGYHLIGVAHGEWWRMITAAFLHYGPLHLGMNMYGLYLGGTLLEHVIGRWRFALLYLASGVAGSAGALLFTPNSTTAGASGAIFGIFGALFVLERQRHISTGGQVAMLIILNLVFTFAVPGISIGGHIGGLIAGVLLMLMFLRYRHSTVYSASAAAAVTAISVVVAYMKMRGYQ